ncbi:hypothetical protein O0555_21700 [Brevibacillus laterosporus]|uniref:hypothetical protein n=1 Tax=Brevibacillus TaxID=55080 RepID=UPI0015EE7B10|nr:MULTISPECIES: hypothetical protein [Brevibacillus]MBA4535440.1 hypothetical protein [Brevibacillus halotolerans]MBG9796918.1 hypothetical protein [Brevibacillus laterosporus]MCR8939920.1 hypothetical protein [Brevibacillus laterosporus]MCZ0842560.1 hypothetical protein [Brevibacillus laterosporus]MCZ0847116.1 hypothetical protein [Brevibacillus laterosporus]
MINQLLTIILTGIVSGIGSGFLTHYLTNKRNLTELKRHNLTKQVELIYLPIILIFENRTNVNSGYRGVTVSDFSVISKIIKDNLLYTDSKITLLLLKLEDECNDKHRMAHSDDIDNFENLPIDEDRIFYDYINFQYNKIKKELQLPYDENFLLTDAIRAYLK